jgi:hypothetical protein
LAACDLVVFAFAVHLPSINYRALFDDLRPGVLAVDIELVVTFRLWPEFQVLAGFISLGERLRGYCDVG